MLLLALSMPKSTYELKTKQNKQSVAAFLNTVADPDRRKDAKAILKLMKEITGEKPTMWGSSIIGFGSYDYTSKSGIKGTWPLTGFSPRKQNLTIYIMPGFAQYADLMQTLGPHKTGKSCLYIKSLEDICLTTLKKLIRQGFNEMKKRYA